MRMDVKKSVRGIVKKVRVLKLFVLKNKNPEEQILGISHSKPQKN